MPFALPFEGLDARGVVPRGGRGGGSERSERVVATLSRNSPLRESMDILSDAEYSETCLLLSPDREGREGPPGIEEGPGGAALRLLGVVGRARLIWRGRMVVAEDEL